MDQIKLNAGAVENVAGIKNEATPLSSIQVDIHSTRTRKVTSFYEDQSDQILELASNNGAVRWELSGPDAHLFGAKGDGGVFFLSESQARIDFEKPIDAGENGVFDVNISSFNQLGQLSNIEQSAFKMMDVAESPSWLFKGGYGSSNIGVQSLLSLDNSQSSWHDDSSTFNTPIVVTYAIQNEGAVASEPNDQDGRTTYAIDRHFSAETKKVIRDIFQTISSVANIQFQESSSQAIDGADIRLFCGSANLLLANMKPTTLAYAYQPFGQQDNLPDYYGNLYFVDDSMGRKAGIYPEFSQPFGTDVQTLLHEILHTVGLDHPFKNGTNAGFNGYQATGSGQTSTNDLGLVTGGAHNSALTDSLLESVMTYHDSYKGPNVSSNAGLVSSFAPNGPSIYDVAALQNVYGQNLKTRTGNDFYAFDEKTPSFATIWDAGGEDTIEHIGAEGALINLQEGTQSRLGRVPGWQFQSNPYDQLIESVSLVQPRDGDVKVVDGGHAYLFTASLSAYGLDGAVEVHVKLADQSERMVKIYVSQEIETEAFMNVGIAFGTTIENAIGGDGDDQIAGNAAVNHLQGGKGDDLLTGGGAADVFVYRSSFGHDVISDFHQGVDLLEFGAAFAQASFQFTNEQLSVAGFGTIDLPGVSRLQEGVDYVVL